MTRYRTTTLLGRAMRSVLVVQCVLGMMWLGVEAAAPPISTLGSVIAAAGNTSCRLSEATCSSVNARQRCISLTRVCDRVDDCGDGSDEPRSCTACNRTYYGDLGKTYQLSVHRPREDRLPFICDLTFRAPGGSYGDFVQLTFDSFTLGRFTSWTQAGCPDGDLQIWESVTERPQVGGRWCGTAWGPPALYYSETGSVTLHLRLNRMPSVGGNAIPLGGSSIASMGINFDFSIGFKVLSRESAVVRYGGRTNDSAGFQQHRAHPETKYYLGELMSGTYCSRIYNDCSTKLCRLQSPNFPGVYPRNITCYYAVRQREVPAGTYALISVSQPSGQMISIRSRGTLPGSSRSGETVSIGEAGRSSAHRIQVWTECNEVQDYVTVYDGYTVRDPVLMKFCGGGQPVPPVVSSSHELLVEFTSSPYGTFLAPPAATEQGGQLAFQPGGIGGALHGFELQVEVKFVPLHTPTYARNKSCEFWIRQSTEPLPNGRSDTGGRLENPSHSLPPNTTCVYHISAAEGTSRVWISVLRYHVSSTLDPTFQDEKCSAELRLWDGDLVTSLTPHCESGHFCERPRFPFSVAPNRGMPGRNASLLARYCKDLSDRSCEHALLANATRSPRPCRTGAGQPEAFVSSGAAITLELKLAESTTLRPVKFTALYEFVDPHQDGEPFGPGSCDRRFKSKGRSGPSSGLLPFRDLRDNTFRSPRNIFLYGRGGARNLKCRYRFEAEPGERVKLTITRLLTGPGPSKCHSVLDPVLSRHRCVGTNFTARAIVHEVPWPQHDRGQPVLVPRECACSPEAAPLVYVSTGTAVELVLEAQNMSQNLDYDDILIEGRYEFIATPACTGNRKVTGPSGEIRVRSPSSSPQEVQCENYPWLLIPSSGKYLYVKVRGHLIPDPVPSTHNATDINNVVPSSPPCLTKNRIIIYSSGKIRATVCPMSSYRTSIVEVFSAGWEEVSYVDRNLSLAPQDERSRRLIIEFVAREPGSYAISWLEVEPLRKLHGPVVLPPHGYTMIGEKEERGGLRRLDHCAYRCPELAACINASLFCDGYDHCPSGYDESSEFCAPYFLRLPQLLYVALATAGLFALCAALFVGGRRARFRRHRKQSRLKLLLPPGSAGKDLAIS